jgi:hypothetical protein
VRRTTPGGGQAAEAEDRLVDLEARLASLTN